MRRFPDRNPQNHRSTYLATLKIRNREPSQGSGKVVCIVSGGNINLSTLAETFNGTPA